MVWMDHAIVNYIENYSPDETFALLKKYGVCTNFIAESKKKNKTKNAIFVGSVRQVFKPCARLISDHPQRVIIIIMKDLVSKEAEEQLLRVVLIGNVVRDLLHAKIQEGDVIAILNPKLFFVKSLNTDTPSLTVGPLNVVLWLFRNESEASLDAEVGVDSGGNDSPLLVPTSLEKESENQPVPKNTTGITEIQLQQKSIHQRNTLIRRASSKTSLSPPKNFVKSLESYCDSQTTTLVAGVSGVTNDKLDSIQSRAITRSSSNESLSSVSTLPAISSAQSISSCRRGNRHSQKQSDQKKEQIGTCYEKNSPENPADGNHSEKPYVSSQNRVKSKSGLNKFSRTTALAENTKKNSNTANKVVCAAADSPNIESKIMGSCAGYSYSRKSSNACHHPQMRLQDNHKQIKRNLYQDKSPKRIVSGGNDNTPDNEINLNRRHESFLINSTGNLKKSNPKRIDEENSSKKQAHNADNHCLSSVPNNDPEKQRSCLEPHISHRPACVQHGSSHVCVNTSKKERNCTCLHSHNSSLMPSCVHFDSTFSRAKNNSCLVPVLICRNLASSLSALHPKTISSQMSCCNFQKSFCLPENSCCAIIPTCCCNCSNNYRKDDSTNQCEQHQESNDDQQNQKEIDSLSPNFNNLTRTHNWVMQCQRSVAPVEPNPICSESSSSSSNLSTSTMQVLRILKSCKTNKKKIAKPPEKIVHSNTPSTSNQAAYKKTSSRTEVTWKKRKLYNPRDISSIIDPGSPQTIIEESTPFCSEPSPQTPSHSRNPILFGDVKSTEIISPSKAVSKNLSKESVGSSVNNAFEKLNLSFSKGKEFMIEKNIFGNIEHATTSEINQEETVVKAGESRVINCPDSEFIINVNESELGPNEKLTVVSSVVEAGNNEKHNSSIQISKSNSIAETSKPCTCVGSGRTVDTDKCTHAKEIMHKRSISEMTSPNQELELFCELSFKKLKTDSNVTQNKLSEISDKSIETVDLGQEDLDENSPANENQSNILWPSDINEDINNPECGLHKYLTRNSMSHVLGPRLPSVTKAGKNMNVSSSSVEECKDLNVPIPSTSSVDKDMNVSPPSVEAAGKMTGSSNAVNIDLKMCSTSKLVDDNISCLPLICKKTKDLNTSSSGESYMTAMSAVSLPRNSKKPCDDERWIVKHVDEMFEYKVTAEKLLELNASPYQKDEPSSLIKGFCHMACKQSYKYNEFSEMEILQRHACSNCRYLVHYVCPGCSKSGLRHQLCLFYSFEIHLLVSDSVLRVEVAHQDGVDFIGATPLTYLRCCRKIAVKLKRIIMSSPPKDKNSVVLLRANIKSVAKMNRKILTLHRTSLTKHLTMKGSHYKFTTNK